MSGFRAIALRNGSIALASYYRDTQVQACGLQVFTLSTINGQMDYHQNYHYTDYSTTTPTSPPKEMAYLSDSSFILVTDTIIVPTTVTILRLYAYPTYTPFTAFYMAPQFVPNDLATHYTSLSELSPTTNYGFAASGAAWTSFNMTTFVYPFLYNPNVDCHIMYMVDMSKCIPFKPRHTSGGTRYPYTKSIKTASEGIDPSQTTFSQCHTRTQKQ